MKYIHLIVAFFLLVGFFSCKKFVQVDPPVNQLVRSTVFSSDATATSAMTGIYSRIMQGRGFASGADGCVGFLTALSSDELVNYAPSRNQFSTNSLNASNSDISQSLWADPYQNIYSANALIEGLNQSEAVTNSVKEKLTGEAKFIRAFLYFYLVNLYGDVPLHTTTDYRINSVAGRTPVSQIYEQIVRDLTDAQNSLPDDYSFSGEERTRPTKWAATALLARVYLYIGDWEKAEAQATSVINNTVLYGLEELDNVFLANNKEAIWQLMPVRPKFNSNEARYFILKSSPETSGGVAIRPELLSAFELTDKRKTSWLKSFTDDDGNAWYYAYKYKITSSTPAQEYSVLLRLSEQYLIRSEAKVHQGNIDGAQDDLNVIRNRAGLTNTTAADENSLLLAIEKERRVELFTEWGHRWFDLKRTGRADAVLAPIKGSDWQSTDVLYPIPQNERVSNPKISQNLGY